MSFNQVENHFEPFLRYIDCEVVLNICSLLSIVQISRLYLERQARPRRGLQHHFRRQRAKQSPSPCPPSVKKIRRGFTREGWLHIVSAKNNSFLLIYNSSSVSFRTWYIMCPWKIHPQWNCLNSRSSADVTGTVSAEGDLDWCGIWHEGNGSPLSVGKLSVKCCHCIKACLCVHTPKCVCMRLRVREHAHVRTCVCVCVRLQYACPCMIASAFMPHSAGGAGRENSLQKLLQQTGTNSWIWASAEWTGCVFVFLFNSVATIQTPQLRFP